MERLARGLEQGGSQVHSRPCPRAGICFDGMFWRIMAWRASSMSFAGVTGWQSPADR